MLCRHNISSHIEIPLSKFLPFVSYSTTIQSQWEDLLFPPSLLLHLKLFSLIRERSSLQLLNSRPVKRNNHIFSPHMFPLCYNSAGKLRKIYTITLQICRLLLNNIRNFFPDIINNRRKKRGLQWDNYRHRRSKQYGKRSRIVFRIFWQKTPTSFRT